jgi:hypothetical protein
MKKNEVDKAGLPSDPNEMDRWLRNQLDPSPEQVNRIVQKALSAEPAALRGKWLLGRTPVIATASFYILAALVALILIRFAGNNPQTQTAIPNVSEGNIATITNESGKVELKMPAGNNINTAADEKADKKEVIARIFNEDGLVVAEVNNGGVHYVMIGGEE